MAVLKVKNVTIGNDDKIIAKNINFSIEKGEWLALVGESGSGKSVLSSSIAKLLPKNLSVLSGDIEIDGKNVLNLSNDQLRGIRGCEVSYIFQDYQGAFSPFIKIGKQIDEMIRCHTKGLSKDDRQNIILKALEDVKLSANRIYDSYAFELSGGQLQRCAIACAIVLKPKLIIADEITTAIDAITTSQILKLLFEIKQKNGCSLLFITHDLRCVKNYADRVAIMNQGEIVEMGDKDKIFENPEHVYTKNLFACIPPIENVPYRLNVSREYAVV